MINQISPIKIKQLILITILIVLYILIGYNLYSLLSAFLGAVTLYVLLRNWFIKIVTNWGWKKWVTSLILILFSVLVIIVPTVIIGEISYQKAEKYLLNPEQSQQFIKQIQIYIDSKLQVDILNAENLQKVSGWLATHIQQLVSGTLAMFGNMLMMLLILYFMLMQTFDIEKWMRQKLPFKQENNQTIISALRNLIYSNAVGIPVVAILQGLTALIGYWLFGIQDFIFWGILTAICSVIPVVGAMVIYGPMVVYMLSINATWQAVAIGLWGLLIVGSVDNIARFLLQKKLSDIHPLITILGVIIGIPIFGFLGIIFGPILISFSKLLTKIYLDEFGEIPSDSKK